MKRPLYIRIAVFSFFILFIAGFVAYRSGYFEKSDDQALPDLSAPATTTVYNDNTLNTAPASDSPPKARSMMYSSKSMSLPEPSKPQFKFPVKERSVYNSLDTSPKPKAMLNKNVPSFDEIMMISGSKSGQMIPIRLYSKPAVLLPPVDSVKGKVLIPSSKSGLLIPVRPEKHKY